MRPACSKLFHLVLKQSHACCKGTGKGLLFIKHHRGNIVNGALDLRIRLLHLLGDQSHHFVQHRLFKPQ